MSDYHAPVRDILFTLDTICDVSSITALPAFDDVDAEMVEPLVTEAARFFEEVFAPTNAIGDDQGAQFADGSVTMPEAFEGAWDRLKEAGWGAVTGAPAFGGGGFPRVIGQAISEMMASSNMAFSLCHMLTDSAITLLERHGTDELRDIYLENLITGEWTGTMVLTEPEAGSDVGALKAKAEPNDDGTYRISGSKIFITWGDHNLADNVIHLVLARAPGGPPGTKGISLFLVPKFLVDDEGRPAERNAVETVSIEHKLGIHASPTCVLSFNDATGYLIGEEHRGMTYMFTMMNQARLGVGLEGLGIAERAYQLASAYAKERIQGRTPEAAESDAIIGHADVRRALLTMKAYTEAMRGLLYDAMAAEDRMHAETDEARRAQFASRLALLTPIAKAWCTDRGVDVASLGIQVHGGMGFIEETGAAQHYRDVRITPIYEGTNGIQDIDLVMRKLPLEGGAVIKGYLDEIEALAKDVTGRSTDLDDIGAALTRATAAARQATTILLAADDAQMRLAGATPYLDAFGTLAGAYYLARQAAAAQEAPNGDAWLASKVATARFYAANILPDARGKFEAAVAGPDLIYAVPDGFIG